MLFTDTRKAYKPKPGELPDKPGVYRFSDVRGKILYIGKAKSLKNRVANYFQPWQALPLRTQKMLSLATGLDWTVVASDTEALLLEQQWIRQIQPPYNVIFRDDKTFPYLAVTLGHEAPRLEITRRTNIPGARYYGPYPKVWALKETLQLLQQAFQIRTCNDGEYARAMRTGRACLPGQIGRCFGPCSQQISISEHRARITELVTFLNTLDAKELSVLENKMFAAAAAENFELAAKLRDQKQALELVLERNAIVLETTLDADFFGLVSDNLTAAVHQFMIRGGRIRGERSWLVNMELEQSAANLMQQVIQDAYAHTAPPKTLYVSTLPQEIELVAASLSSQYAIRPLIKQPQRGKKAKLLDTAQQNAREHLQRDRLKTASDLKNRSEALAQIQQALQLPEAPLRIECIDVSHLHGTGIVASLVVFEDGLPVKSAYRKYKIASAKDDTDAVYQVVKRRAARIAAAGGNSLATDTPQLLVIDGALPQVNAALRALSEQNLQLPVCGIAKRLEEIWVPDSEYPLILPRKGAALLLMQRLRDEAHRFAITFQRQTRQVAIGTVLTDIPGLGSKRAQLLLQHFGSVKRLKQATLAEISAVNGISQKLATDIQRALAAQDKLEE